MSQISHTEVKLLKDATYTPYEQNLDRYFVVRRGHILVRRFDSFYEAYRYALNSFCSEDFLVQREER